MGRRRIVAEDFIFEVGYIWSSGSMNLEAWQGGNLSSVAQYEQGKKEGGIDVVVFHHLIKECLHHFVVVD